MDLAAVSMIVGYLLVVTLVGSVMAVRARSSSDWAVAGGGMGVMMIAVGVAGTRIGGAGTYGVAGDVIREGVWNLWYGVSTFLAMAVVGLFFAIPYRRLNLHTVGEIFWLRFRSRRCQRLTSLCVQTEYLIVNIIEPFVIATILEGVAGTPFHIGVYIGAAVIISYTALGGLWGSSATNTIHCAMILIGLGAVGLAGLNHLGGWSGITERVESVLTAGGHDVSAWWSIAGAGPWAILGMIFSAVVHTPAASIYVNFSSAARNERVLLPAFLLGGLIGALMPFLAAWIGIETVAAYGREAQLTSYRTVTQLATDINPWIGGIALAAILAAVISSGGPILLSSSTMFVNDWIPHSQDLEPAAKLRAYRVTTVFYGLLAATIAWLGEISSILDLLLLGFAMVVPPAIAVAYLLYWKRTNEKGAFWGIVLGYAGGLAWYGLIRLAALVEFRAEPDDSLLRRAFHFCFVHDGKGIDPSYATTLIPLFVVPLLSLLTRDDAENRDDFYARIAPRGGQSDGAADRS